MYSVFELASTDFFTRLETFVQMFKWCWSIFSWEYARQNEYDEETLTFRDINTMFVSCLPLPFQTEAKSLPLDCF